MEYLLLSSSFWLEVSLIAFFTEFSSKEQVTTPSQHCSVTFMANKFDGEKFMRQRERETQTALLKIFSIRNNKY